VGLSRAWIVVVAAAALLAGCEECPKIRQLVTLPAQDDQLQPLVDSCTMHVPDGANGCTAKTSTLTSTTEDVACGCLALCRRVLEVIDQFPGDESLIGCALRPSPDAGWGVAVDIIYRPSTCR
jgi:hypothetical protein